VQNKSTSVRRAKLQDRGGEAAAPGAAMATELLPGGDGSGGDFHRPIRAGGVGPDVELVTPIKASTSVPPGSRWCLASTPAW
jgi:hypothetical protein